MDWVLLAESLPSRGFVNMITSVKESIVHAEENYHLEIKRGERLQEEVEKLQALHRAKWERLDNMRDARHLHNDEAFFERLAEAEKEVDSLAKRLYSAEENKKFAGLTETSSKHYITVLKAVEAELRPADPEDPHIL
jgi:hypothetical protein